MYTIHENIMEYGVNKTIILKSFNTSMFHLNG